MRYGDTHAGDRVYLRVRPAITGTIARTSLWGFTVTYDFPGRKPYEPRSRFCYPWAMGEKFITGAPPVT